MSRAIKVLVARPRARRFEVRRLSLVALILLAAFALATPAGASYLVYTGGPLNSFGIDFYIDNTGPGDITRI